MKVIKGNLIDSTSENGLRIREDSCILIDGGMIKGVYASHQLPEEYKDVSAEDYGSRLIIPGLTDLHLHAPQFGFRGLGMDMELLDWLNTYTFPEEARYKDLEYAKKAYAKFVDSLKKSYTTRAVIFATLHLDATLLLMDMLEESGLKCHVGKVNMDRNSPDNLIETTESSINSTKEWLKVCNMRYNNTKPIITPRFIPSCSDRLLAELAEIRGDEYGLQSHLSENPSEVEWVHKLCPDSEGYLDAYDKRGNLKYGKNKTIMAHCVYSDEREMELLKERDVYVAHCPQSNTALASGIAPVRKFLDRGISVGLGSDVAAAYSLNILNIAAEAVGVSKLYWRYIDSDDRPLSISEAFALASRGGGSYFGKAGAFEEGFEADILVIDDSTLNENISDIEKRAERFMYISDECSLTAKYVSGQKII